MESRLWYHAPVSWNGRDPLTAAEHSVNDVERRFRQAFFRASER